MTTLNGLLNGSHDGHEVPLGESFMPTMRTSSKSPTLIPEPVNHLWGRMPIVWLIPNVTGQGSPNRDYDSHIIAAGGPEGTAVVASLVYNCIYANVLVADCTDPYFQNYVCSSLYANPISYTVTYYYQCSRKHQVGPCGKLG